MKLVIVAVLAVVALASAAPQGQVPVPISQVIPIVRSENDQQPDGAYNYLYETGNGINQQEQGELKTVNDEENKPHVVITVRGSYSYPDNDGQQHSITYYADETGFHADGADVPKAPVARR